MGFTAFLIFKIHVFKQEAAIPLRVQGNLLFHGVALGMEDIGLLDAYYAKEAVK
jgi:hypothetical protein